MSKFSDGIIPGVAVMTIGEATGHDLFVDQTTIEQIESLGNEFSNGVKVKANHGGGVDTIIGRAKNFRIDGQTVRADLYLLENYNDRSRFMEIAEVMPEEVGLSATFSGIDEPIDDKTFARASELYSVDLVEIPAANPTGLFSRKFDSHAKSMESKEIAEIVKGVLETELAEIKAMQEEYKTELASIKEMMAPKELSEEEEKEMAEKEKAMEEKEEEKAMEEKKEMAALISEAVKGELKAFESILGGKYIKPSSSDGRQPAKKDFNAILQEEITANPNMGKSEILRKCIKEFSAEYTEAVNKGTLKQF
jgi:hypothetical protein